MGVKMVNYLKIFIKFFYFNIKAISEFKLEFLINTLTMLIGNIIMFFSMAYVSVNIGVLTKEDYLKSLTLFMLAWLLSSGFSRGFMGFSTKIVNGELDLLLIRPKSLYFKLLVEKMNPFIFGELITTILLLLIVKDKFFIFKYLFPSMILIHSVISLANSLNFFIKSNYGVRDVFIDGLFTSSFYPPVWRGFLEKLFFYIFPGAMASFGPVFVEKGLINSLAYYLVVFVFALLAYLAWKIGLKKYESVGY